MGRTSCRERYIAFFVVPQRRLIFIGAAAAPSAEVLYQQARAAFSRGNAAQTRDLAANALKQLGDGDSELAWRVRILYGDALMGNPAEAKALLQRPLPPALAGTEIEVMRLRGLAVAAKRLRDHAAGDAWIRQAHKLAEKHPRTLPNVLLVLATYDDRKGDQWAREALRLAQKYKDVQSETRARGTIGYRLANDGRFDEAIDVWEPVLKQARALGDESLVQKIEGNLGWAHLELGDYETASAFFSRALAKAQQLGAIRELVPWNYQLGNVLLHKGDLEGAQKQYRAAYDIAVRTSHDQKGTTLVYMANAALLAGQLVDAHRYADAALEERKKEKNPEPALRCHLLDARIAMAEGKLDDAEVRLKDVLAQTKSEQTRWEAHGHLARLYVRTGKATLAEDSFRKAVTIVRGMRSNVNSDELRFAFFTSMTELFDSYIDFLIARGRAADALNVTETARAQTLEEGLSEEGKSDGVERGDTRTIARETGATILCYWLGSARSYLWVVTPKTIESIALPPKRKIEAAVERYQDNLMSGAGGSINQSGARGAELWRMLVEPAARVLGPRSRVIVVPDGRLHAFNMETLVVPKPKPHYWIEDVVLSTSGSLALLLRKENATQANPRVLLVGDPPQPAPEFAPLPRAGEEIRRVRKHFGTRSMVLSGPKATPSAYRASSPEAFTHLHFVAHGVATRLKPLDSAVVLAREGESFKLYARDIANQPLNARLVTISSCHGAGTRTYAGEGLVGLSWAFQRAGADNVIAALWQVNDRATPGLMDAFYAGLVKGTHPAIALRDAKLSLLKKGGAHSRPMYWAPFTLYGSA